MDIGQMMTAVPLASQVNAAEPLQASAVTPVQQGLFADLMQGRFQESQATAEATNTGSKTQAVFSGEILNTADPELLAALLTGENQETSALPDTSANGNERVEESAQTIGQLPQDVALLWTGTQGIQSLQNGRMPESQINDQSGRPDVSESLQVVSAGRIEGQAALPADVDPGFVKNQDLKAAKEFAAVKTEVSIPLPRQTTQQPDAAVKTAEPKQTPVIRINPKPLAAEGGSAQADVRSLTTPPAIGFSDSGTRGSSLAVPGDSAAVSVETTSVVEKQVTIRTSANSVPITSTTNAATPVAPQSARFPENVVVPSELRGATPLSAQVASQQTEVSPVQSGVAYPQAAVVMEQIDKKSSSREVATKQLDPAVNKKNIEGAAIDLQKLAGSFAENEVMSEGDSETADQGLTEHFLLPNPLQHSKVDGKQFETATVAGSKEAARTDQSENVVRQVKDMLVTREIKTGNEQMTLKLSPEHLGELTLNLKMENQQLRVQIIAENQGVKEALMQHAESLKESLSRQNIKMESFEVVTSNGQRGFEQNDRGWKQMAQQQFLTRAPAYGSGYSVAEASTPSLPHYGGPQQYSMVDVHF